MAVILHFVPYIINIRPEPNIPTINPNSILAAIFRLLKNRQYRRVNLLQVVYDQESPSVRG